MTNDIKQGSEEWNQLRLGKITASRVSDVIAQIKSGESASKSEYRIELVCERLTGKATEGYTNAHMERGIELEPFARAAYEIKQGLFVEQVAFVDHPTVKNSGASPDGLVDKDGCIEIKCPMVKTHVKTILDKKAPIKYIPQMQWQMACTGRKWVDFVSYCPDLPENMQIFITRVNRDDEYIAMLEDAVRVFDSEIDMMIERLKGM